MNCRVKKGRLCLDRRHSVSPQYQPDVVVGQNGVVRQKTAVWGLWDQWNGKKPWTGTLVVAWGGENLGRNSEKQVGNWFFYVCIVFIFFKLRVIHKEVTFYIVRRGKITSLAFTVDSKTWPAVESAGENVESSYVKLRADKETSYGRLWARPATELRVSASGALS